jgi:rare lipoprotein A
MKDIGNGGTMGDIIYNMTKSQGRFDKSVSNTIKPISGNKNFNGILKTSIDSNSQDKNESERWLDYTIKKGDTIWGLAVKRYHVNVDDIIRDNNIKDPRKIQPGDKIRIRISQSQTDRSPQTVIASWYGSDYHGKTMANGDFFNMYAPTIAHKTLPLGTRVELENKETGVKVQAVVTDRGPFVAGRDVDLSYGLAKALSIYEKGTGKLIMRVIG